MEDFGFSDEFLKEFFNFNIMFTAENKQEKSMKKKKIYYAHPMILYGSLIEHEDVKMLEDMGFEVINPNSPGNEEKYLERRAFGFFLDMVRDCNCIAFRSIFGKISTGVGKEINYALDHKMPLIELPYITSDRFLTQGETEKYFRPYIAKDENNK